jgi:hypothetical protein
VPIGTFLHLVFDAAWGRTEVFWWPVFGWSFEGARLPTVERGWTSVLLEGIGAAALVWAWRRFGLERPGPRRALIRTGHLDPGTGA